MVLNIFAHIFRCLVK
uniref:Uncharacterized protein n=1 Tax=Arundo donax TaxID=35708 RepID=A0A0A9C7S5_ARUDO